MPLDNLIFVANDFYEGLIKPLKVVKGHVTYVDGEIQDVTKNRFLA